MGSMSDAGRFMVNGDVYMIKDLEMTDLLDVEMVKRPRPLPAGTWNRYRPIITDMYVEEGMALKDLKAVMADRYGFVASEQMYKKRFAIWGLTKNFGKRVLRLQAYARACGRSVSSILINDRPIDLQKLERYNRRRSIRMVGAARSWRKEQNLPSAQCLEPADEDAVDDLKNSSNTDANPSHHDRVSHSSRHHEYSSLQLPLISQRALTDRGAVESLLWNSCSYYQWYFQQTEIEKILHMDHDLLFVFGFIENAAAMTREEEFPKALSLINRACGHIRSLLVAQPFLLIHVLFDAFARWKWTKVLCMRRSLLRFIVAMAEVSLGKQHILTKICRLLLNDDLLDTADRTFLTLLSEVVSRHVDPESWDWKNLRLTLVMEYTEAGDLNAAEALLQVFMGSTSHLPELDDDFEGHIFRLEAIRHQARIRRLQNRVDEAEALYMDVVTQHDRIYGMPNIDYSGILAYNGLAAIAEQRGDFVRAEKYYYFALEGALRESSVDNYDVLRDYQNLERVYLVQQKADDLKQLQHWAGHVLKYWNERIVESDLRRAWPGGESSYMSNAPQKLIKTRWKPPRAHWFDVMGGTILFKCTRLECPHN